MITLYYKPTCAFSRRVLAVVDRLGLEIEKKDISSDDSAMAELMEKGGKEQTPFLVDSEHDVAMYESDDIVAHLQNNYGDDTAVSSKPRVHVSGATCVSCEG